MKESKQTEIPVVLRGSERVVYAIPAKPKKKPSFWYRNADGLLLIWGCIVLAVWIWFNP